MSVTHYTPEESWYAECGTEGREGDMATLNPAKVTCPDCVAIMEGDDD